MLNYNEIKERKYIILDEEPYEVIDTHVFRKQQRKPVNQTKLRNLITGGMKAHTFHSSDVVEEADIEKKKVTFLFKKPNHQSKEMEYFFCHDGDRSKRFSLFYNIVGDLSKFMKENEIVDALLFNDEVIGITLPLKVNLKVVEAPPAVKGNTSTGATKQITLETGVVINAPLFIKEGDVVAVKTETGEYTERVSE